MEGCDARLPPTPTLTLFRSFDAATLLTFLMGIVFTWQQLAGTALVGGITSSMLVFSQWILLQNLLKHLMLCMYS